MHEVPFQLVRGTLHVLILRTLSDGPLHGYEIASAIGERSRGLFGIEDGALYQALHRMQARGWLESEWGHAENGKRARYYSLTTVGKSQLRRETESWLRYAEAVSRILGGAPA